MLNERGVVKGGLDLSMILETNVTRRGRPPRGKKRGKETRRKKNKENLGRRDPRNQQRC
jgi:hypothetical protein